jgi:hypothetical protein
MWVSGATVEVTGCTFSENTSVGPGGGFYLVHDPGPLTIRNSTFVSNRASEGSGFSAWSNDLALVENTVVAFGLDGEAVVCASDAAFQCCDIYGNEGGDWVGPLEDDYGINGNFSTDPLFCDPGDEGIPMLHSALSPYALHTDSPCLPGQHPDGFDCGLVGAHGVGCGPSTAPPVAKAGVVEETSWGRIKAGYR